MQKRRARSNKYVYRVKNVSLPRYRYPVVNIRHLDDHWPVIHRRTGARKSRLSARLASPVAVVRPLLHFSRNYLSHRCSGCYSLCYCWGCRCRWLSRSYCCGASTRPQWVRVRSGTLAQHLHAENCLHQFHSPANQKKEEKKNNLKKNCTIYIRNKWMPRGKVVKVPEGTHHFQVNFIKKYI